MELEIRCLNDVGRARAGVNPDRTLEKSLDKCRISFLQRSVYDTVPSFANLQQWGKVKTQTVRCVEREGSYVAYSIMVTRSCKSGEIYMATWQCPSGVGWYAGNGEEKETTIRHEAKADTIFETLWINSWTKSGKTYIIARHRAWRGALSWSR